MRIFLKKQIACLLSALFLCQLCLPVASAEKADTEVSESTETESDASDWVPRSEEAVLRTMRLVAENKKLALYVTAPTEGEQQEDLFALKNLENGYIWWSSPIQAGGDRIATKVLRKELGSALVLTYVEPNSRSTTKHRSGDDTKCTITQSERPDGVQVTYQFRKAGIRIPVSYTLCEDYLEVRIDSRDITEKFNKDDADAKKYILSQSLSVLNAFGAADSEEEGYFIVPDGCGAMIRFNNGKTSAHTYSQMVYGADTTAVPQTKGPTVEGVSLPMYGICKGENALLAIATEGDGSCLLNADVSGTGQSNTEYNRCYFQFILRAHDSYYLGGDSINPLDIYEKEIEQNALAVRYYPLSVTDPVNADKGEQLDAVDLAAKYREYLLKEKAVPISAAPDFSTLCVDVYGGCMKKRNILGFPVSMKTPMTSFQETKALLESLQAEGVSALTLTLHNWTNPGISGKVDETLRPASVLGGKSDFKVLTEYLDSEKIDWYPTVSNTAFYSGNGYYALRDTAVRVSGAFARIVDYERAFGLPDAEKKPMSLLSPTTFDPLYRGVVKNAKKNGLHSISVGALSSTLYGDYDPRATITREQAKTQITESLSLLKQEVGTMLSSDPNAYVLPYTDFITDLPLSSSGFRLFDADVPLYQMILHGVIPYSSEAVNAAADSRELVLRSAATGSNLRFDFVHADSNKLKDTDFDRFFYAGDSGQLRFAAQYDAFLKDILSPVSDSYLIGYQEEGNIIRTRYANGIETVTDLENATVTQNGTRYALADYLTEGDGGLG